MKEQLVKIFPWGIAALLFLLVIILLFRNCGPVPGSTVTVIHDTVPGDPYPVEAPVRVPYPVYIDTGTTRYIAGAPLPTDTDAIIKDYLVTRFYRDTLKNDTSMLAVVEDSVQANRIVSRKFTYQNRRPTAIITTTNITQNKKEAFLRAYMGIGASYSPSTKRFGVGPFVAVTLRPGPIVVYAYDVAGNSHQVQFGWKLTFRRRP